MTRSARLAKLAATAARTTNDCERLAYLDKIADMTRVARAGYALYVAPWQSHAGDVLDILM